MKRDRGAFARWAAHLLQGGHSPIPIIAGTRRPLLKGWDRLRTEALSEREIRNLVALQPGLGLAVAGGFNGLVPIDVDTKDREIIDAICSVLPAPLVARTGSKGFTAFYRDPTGTIAGRKFQTPRPDVRMLLEILSTTKAVIPPTIHPDTRKPYRRLTGRTLFDTRVEELPEFTRAHERALAMALERWVPRWTPKLVVDVAAGTPVSNRRMEAYARVVLHSEVRRLEAIPKNAGRNHQLFIASCKLGRYVHNKVLSLDEVASTLLAACKLNGLVTDDGLRQCHATLASGIRKAANDTLPALGSDRKRA